MVTNCLDRQREYNNRPCDRPGCNNPATDANAVGEVTLYLEKSTDIKNGVMVDVEDAKICATCSVDLGEWWNRGKKS